MQRFKSLADVESASLESGVARVVRDAVTCLLSAYGEEGELDDDNYVVLVDGTPRDDEARTLFGTTWLDARLEGVVHDPDAGVFSSAVLTSNDSGYTLVFVDGPWLGHRLRRKLLDERVAAVGKARRSHGRADRT